MSLNCVLHERVAISEKKKKNEAKLSPISYIHRGYSNLATSISENTDCQNPQNLENG